MNSIAIPSFTPGPINSTKLLDMIRTRKRSSSAAPGTLPHILQAALGPRAPADSGRWGFSCAQIDARAGRCRSLGQGIRVPNSPTEPLTPLPAVVPTESALSGTGTAAFVPGKAIESIRTRPISAGRSSDHHRQGHYFPANPNRRDPVIPLQPQPVSGAGGFVMCAVASVLVRASRLASPLPDSDRLIS
jgi:hypothetical protein